MGAVLKMLCETKLPERERHHSRIFVDIGENIHLHFREYRFVFSADEFLEFSSVIAKSAEDVRSFLEQNPDYREMKYPTTIAIAGGKNRQLKFIANSPAPNTSAYFDGDFAVELQEPFVTDEIHIHYRDARIAMDRGRFRAVSEAFQTALRSLEEFEKTSPYARTRHPDREFDDFNQKEDISRSDTELPGLSKVPFQKIRSHYFGDLSTSWEVDKQAVEELKREIRKGRLTAPILLSKADAGGVHTVIDGHHRARAAYECGKATVDAVILDLTFEETKNLRQAEVALRHFDQQTRYRYGVSVFLQKFAVYRLNRHYANVFVRLMARNRGIHRIFRISKKWLLGKAHDFKTFQESYRKRQDRNGSGSRHPAEQRKPVEAAKS